MSKLCLESSVDCWSTTKLTIDHRRQRGGGDLHADSSDADVTY